MNKTLIIIIILLVFFYFLTNIETFQTAESDNQCNGSNRFIKTNCSEDNCDYWAKQGQCTNPDYSEYMWKMCPDQCEQRDNINILKRIYNDNPKLQKEIYDMDNIMLNNIRDEFSGITPELRNRIKDDLIELDTLRPIEWENKSDVRDLIKRILEKVIITNENKIILELIDSNDEDELSTLQEILCDSLYKFNKKYKNACPLINGPIQLATTSVSPTSATSIPSSATSIPSSATSIPSSATSIPSSATSIYLAQH